MMDVRPLGPGELVFARLSEKSSNNAVLVLVLRGAIDLERLRWAYAEASARMPTSGARVVQRDGQSCLEFRQGRRSELIVHRRESEGHWQDLAEAELDLHLPPDGEQLSRAVLVYDADGGELILSSNHVITDGITGDTFTRLMLGLYAGTEPNTNFGPYPALEQVARQRESGWARMRNTLLHLRDHRAQSRRHIYKLPAALPDAVAQPDGVTRFLARQLDLTTSRQVIAACRTHGITVHGAICAATMLAIRATTKCENALNIGFSSPINLRPYLQGNYATQPGYFTGTLDTLATVDAATTLVALAKQINSDMSEQLQRGRPWFNVRMRGLLLRRYKTYEELSVALRQKSRSTFMVTNLGRWHGETQFGSLKLEHSFHLPSCHFLRRPYLVLAAVTVNDILRLSFCYPEPYTDRALVEEIAGDVLRRLEAWAAP